MEESAIIQRLDHMQARGPKGAQVAKLKLKNPGARPGGAVAQPPVSRKSLVFSLAWRGDHLRCCQER